MKSYYEKSKDFKTYEIQRFGTSRYPWIVWAYDADLDEYCRYVESFETLHDAREYVKAL